MRKWRSRTWTHAVLVAGAIFFAPLPPAHAVASVESGWWTTSPVPIGPDVGDDQLLVQGGASEPVAYAGISFVLGPDEQPQRLRLAVAPDSASTPATTLRLCPLTAPARDAAGEPAADGPAFDCGTATVDAGPSSDGTSYEFDVSAFVAEATLDVAVLPSQSSDRVVLSAPAVDALEVASGPATGGSTSSPSPAPVPAPSSSTGGGGTSSFDPGTSSSPSLSPPTASPLELPETGAAPAPAEPAEEAAPRPELEAPAPLESVPASSGSDRGPRTAPIVLVGLAAAAAARWACAGRDAAGGAGVDLPARPAPSTHPSG